MQIRAIICAKTKLCLPLFARVTNNLPPPICVFHVSFCSIAGAHLSANVAAVAILLHTLTVCLFVCSLACLLACLLTTKAHLYLNIHGVSA